MIIKLRSETVIAPQVETSMQALTNIDQLPGEVITNLQKSHNSEGMNESRNYRQKTLLKM